MRDIDIRNELHRTALLEHQNDPSTVVVDELGVLQGTARIDIAVINGHLAGYEIKSARDNLSRLPGQVEVYGEVFDYVHLVLSECHLQAAENLIPGWWGIVVASPSSDHSVSLSTVRKSHQNPHVNARAIAELLWRDEALALLEERGAARGVRSKSRRHIWDRVCEVFELDEIREAVRQFLKRHQDSHRRRERKVAP